jgi:hypothetical protein
MKQFLTCNKTGKLSMMRLGFLISMFIGSVVSLCGALAMFFGLNYADTAMTTGAMLIGSGGFAKAVQSKYESTTD